MFSMNLGVGSSPLARAALRSWREMPGPQVKMNVLPRSGTASSIERDLIFGPVSV